MKVDTDQHEEAVEQYKIQGLPLFGVFVRGKMVHSHSGALSSEQLRQFIAKGLQKTDIKM